MDLGDKDKIKVQIVDDIAETRENLRKLLQFESDFEVVGAARTGREGIDLAKETRPDVILMDINMPDMDGVTATEIIRRDIPYTQIVILSVQGDPNYMRRAMLAGARDYLTKPPSIDELTAAIRRAGRMAQEERSKSRPILVGQLGAGGVNTLGSPGMASGKLIVVYSPKGGAGCTTVATNLAIALFKEDRPVVLVDGNLEFGDVAVFLNEQGKNTIADLAPRAEELDPEIVEEVILTHAASGIKILSCPPRPEFAEDITGAQFGKVLEFLKLMYAYVVVDTASNVKDTTMAALDVADAIVLITTQEIPAIKNARLFLDLMDKLKIDRNRIVFVMNRYDKRIGITPEKVGESFKQEVVATIPYEERVVLPSINRGVPFMQSDKSRPLVRSFLEFAELVRQRVATQDGSDKNDSGGSKKNGKK